MDVSSERDEGTRKVNALLQNQNWTFRIYWDTGYIYIYIFSSKFTSEVLYSVSSLPRINKKDICIILCIYSFLPVFHINRAGGGGEGEGGESREHTQIKWLNTVQSFKVFGFKIFCSCQKKKGKMFSLKQSNNTHILLKLQWRTASNALR